MKQIELILIEECKNSGTKEMEKLTNGSKSTKISE